MPDGVELWKSGASSAHDRYATYLAVHIRFSLLRRFSELAVFDARHYVRVRRIDEPAQRCGACGRIRSQFHVAHELAGALQQAGRIRQRYAVKEPHVYVRGLTEYSDVIPPGGVRVIDTQGRGDSLLAA